MTTKTIIVIIIYNNNDDQAMVTMVVYVRCAQSSLSGDRACMNESAIEGCARVHAVYTITSVGGWVSGRVKASAVLGGNGPDRGWGGPEKRRRWCIKWVGEQRPRFPPLACPIDRAPPPPPPLSSSPRRRRVQATLERSGPELMCVRVYLTTTDWRMDGRKSAR